MVKIGNEIAYEDIPLDNFNFGTTVLKIFIDFS